MREIADLYTRTVAPTARVLGLDAMTSLQPRPRRAPTRPAQPGRPVPVEHEYRRAGALHLCAAFDTRAGEVYGGLFRRTRQQDCLTFLAHRDRTIPARSRPCI